MAETRSREELATILKNKEIEIGQLKELIKSLEDELAASESDRVAHFKEVLVKAKEQIAALRKEIDKLSAPPQSYGRVRRVNNDGTVVIHTVGRELKVNLHPAIDIASLKVGDKVALNDALNIIEVDTEPPSDGDEGKVMSLREDLHVVRVSTRTDETRDVILAQWLWDQKIREGDSLLINGIFAVDPLPKSETDELTLEKVPEIDFSQIGGLKIQIDTLLEAIEYPMLYPKYFTEHRLKPDKGILLYGPPGCGKTLMAKAVANRLAKRLREKTGNADIPAYFLNIKGPELLNKYVGETERKIREAFQRAKEKASEGCPVIIFFDEFESLFRTRGSGISSDIESTIVPQFLTMMDGVEELHNVIVIGASNRQDLIDPAVLRPGRFDLKIKVDRPDEDGAREIFGIYVPPDLPWGKDSTGKPYIGQKAHSAIDRLDGDRRYTVDLSTPELMAKHVIDVAVKHLYYVGPPIAWTDRRGNKLEYNNECVEIAYAGDNKKTLHVKDLLVSGAMINSIATRVKKKAIKRLVVEGERGITMVDFYAAIRDEIQENSDLPNTNNPDDWAKIVGQQSESGSRIVNVRFLGTQKVVKARKVDTLSPGHYL